MMTGGCLCGAVRYAVEGEPLFAGYCHCRDCQKSSAAGHRPFMGFPQTSLKVTGEFKTYANPADSGSTTTRCFCPICGSTVYGDPDVTPGVVTVYAGTLDDPSVFRPQIAIYTRSRHAWDHVGGDLASFETMPPEEDDRPGEA